MALKRKLIFSVVFIFVVYIAFGQILQVTDKRRDWSVSIYEYDDTYTIKAINLKNRKNITIEGIAMRPNPDMYWLNDDVLRIDFGSAVAPDKSSYFFSTKYEKFSKHIFLQRIL